MPTPSPAGRFRFGPYELDVSSSELRKSGRRIKIQQQPLKILTLLVENSGEAVSREKLRMLLWPDGLYVDFEHGLNRSVNKLRRALLDTADSPRYIETLPSRGYRFIASVEPPSIPLSSPATEAASLSTAPANVVSLAPELFDSEHAVTRANAGSRKFIIHSTLAASLVVALVLTSIRFSGLMNPSSGSVSSGNQEISSLVIEKNGALDPIEEGFKLHLLGQYETKVMRNSANHGVDRMKILSNDQAYYYRTLTSAEKQFALSRNWKLTCVCALEKGSASTVIDFGPGLRRFDIAFLQEGSKYFVALTRQVSPDEEWEQKIEFPSVADINYPHTYELRFDHLTQTASLWIDGRLMASGYRGHTQFVEDRGLLFGSYSYLSEKTGVGVFRTVRFEVN
ncbi:MAG TPA: winged helix-turn-helix domain-containing protein [Candidatus Acidoferrum sp.]